MENLQGGTLALDHHYHLDERIRSVGLVTVYAATQDPFDHPVRVTVYDGLADDAVGPDIAARIKQSAHDASHLPIQGLLPVVDFGEIEPGIPFVIEKTRPGPSLTHRIEARDVFAPADVAALVDRIADLLQRAHDAGICHGNLRPDWIVFGDDQAPLDTACLSHLGIGPSMRELVALSQTVLTTDLVDTFAPESFDVASRDDDHNEPSPQDVSLSADATAPHLTPAADQWALAALAYRLLVGVHPFFDDPVDASEGILRIKTESPPSLGEMGIDESVSHVVDRALRHEPDERWPTIEAFSTALRRAIDGPTTSASAGGPSGPSSASDGDAPDADPNPAADASDDDLAFDDRRPVSGPVEPQPSGFLLTGALVALLISNVGWFFWAMDDSPDDAAVERESADAETAYALPTGLQIQTEPSSAELSVLEVDDDEPQILGDTPQAIPQQMLEAPYLRLLVDHDDYHDQQLTIEETDTGQNIVLQLVDAPPTDTEPGN